MAYELVFPDDAFEHVERLQRRARAGSPAELITIALAVLSSLVDHELGGGQVLLVPKHAEFHGGIPAECRLLESIVPSDVSDGS